MKTRIVMLALSSLAFYQWMPASASESGSAVIVGGEQQPQLPAHDIPGFLQMLHITPDRILPSKQELIDPAGPVRTIEKLKHAHKECKPLATAIFSQGNTEESFHDFVTASILFEAFFDSLTGSSHLSTVSFSGGPRSLQTLREVVSSVHADTVPLQYVDLMDKPAKTRSHRYVSQPNENRAAKMAALRSFFNAFKEAQAEQSEDAMSPAAFVVAYDESFIRTIGMINADGERVRAFVVPGSSALRRLQRQIPELEATARQEEAAASGTAGSQSSCRQQ